MKTRVLVVDDELQVRAFLDEALHFLGYAVTVAEAGAAALALLEVERFDMVVTDHRMPGMTGLELARALRERGFSGRIFVVSGVLSARERADYEALRVAGMAAKPISLSELNGLLRGWRIARDAGEVGRVFLPDVP